MRTLKFGKLPATYDPSTPRFADYLRPELPAPAPAYSVLSDVEARLHRTDIGTLFPMDGNDSIGDCTIAALAHAQTIYRGVVGALCILGQQDVERLYFDLTGGADTGLYLLDVLHYWHQHPVNGDRILGYASIDPKNHTHVQQAISLFGGVYTGFIVPNNCIQEFDAGQEWTPAPLTQDGHCIHVVAYDPTAVEVLTWGATEKGTWAWWDECVDECYAIVPPEAFHPQFAPGLNVPQLIADLAAVR